MRRKAPAGLRGRRAADLRKNLTKEQLEWIGIVAIAWNELEIMIDFAMAAGLGIPAPLWLETSTRINGIDGKLQLIRLSRVIYPELNQEIFDTLKLTVDEIGQCKRYRDGVIHARVFDAPSGIGELIQRRGAAEQVLLTVGALKGLYERLVLLRAEMVPIVLIVKGLSGYRQTYPLAYSADDQERRLVEEEVQAHLSQVQEHQKNRRSLPPLPPFPELSRDPQGTEESP
jgi:hypothetical protein